MELSVEIPTLIVQQIVVATNNVLINVGTNSMLINPNVIILA